jgi:hypothetical protein
MIQLVEDIEYQGSSKVPLPPDPNYKKLFVEVASNRKIDIAIVDDRQLRHFETTDDEDPTIEWAENTRNYEEEFEFPNDRKKRFLLFWNSNEKEEAIVAYKITRLK